MEREPTHRPGHAKTLSVRQISGIHILLFTTKKTPTPKMQNPILGIYIATKLQGPSRLLRLAKLVWKISANKICSWNESQNINRDMQTPGPFSICSSVSFFVKQIRRPPWGHQAVRMNLQSCFPDSPASPKSQVTMSWSLAGSPSVYLNC